jgi:hypothetical protein
MRLLDDAREVAQNDLKTLTVTGTMVCVFCGHGACRPNCVRHSIPKIVTALEAAEHLVSGEGNIFPDDLDALYDALKDEPA